MNLLTGLIRDAARLGSKQSSPPGALPTLPISAPGTWRPIHRAELFAPVPGPCVACGEPAERLYKWG
ncbi:MAG: hypothetical protein EON92_17575, partial [Burkholderiales bacterium]